MRKVAIIGGGISGLAAAYYLRKNHPSLEIRIFEASNRCGGLLETVAGAQALMECGPDAMFNEKPWALELCKEIGLEPEIIPTRSENRRSFILCGKKLQPIPAGVYLTAPRSIQAWRQLPGFTWRGKLRMLADLFLPPRKDSADESVAEFVRRRFGRETLEKLAQPMIAGVYSAHPEKLSLLATFPQFREMEREHGSIMRALARSEKTQSASGPRYALFSSLKGGMGTLTDKLQKLFENEIQLAAKVTWLERNDAGWTVQTGWSSYEADAVCVAVPAYAAAEMLQMDCPALAEKLAAIPHEPAATINFLIKKEQVGHPLDGFGFVVPAAARSSLIGCSFSHRKFENRVQNEEYVLLRAFAGGADCRAVFDQPDKVFTEKVFSELKDILAISGEPSETLLRRYPRGMPQYEVGHLERIEDIFQKAESIPGLFLTGISYRGIGIPDCVKQARLAAEKTAEYIASLKVKTRN